MNRKIVLAGIAILAAGGFTAAIAADPSTEASAKGKTREQVKAELMEWQKNPVTADGYRYVNEEIGYVYEGTRTSGTALASGTGAAPQGGMTAQQPKQNRMNYQRSPASSDGYIFVDGEAGWVQQH